MKNRFIDKLKSLFSIDTIASISCGNCPIKEICQRKENEK
jgi:hypothetical protein